MGKPAGEIDAETPSKVAQTLDETKKATEAAETGSPAQPVVGQTEETKNS